MATNPQIKMTEDIKMSEVNDPTFFDLDLPIRYSALVNFFIFLHIPYSRLGLREKARYRNTKITRIVLTAGRQNQFLSVLLWP